MKRHHKRTPRHMRVKRTHNNYRPSGYGRDRGEIDDGKDGKTYYYIYVKAQHNDGKRIFDGPHLSYQAATDYAFNNLPDKQWSIIDSPYRDINHATQAHRHTVLTEEGNGLLDSIKPMRHKIR